MRVLYDTSVLIAGLVATHPHHDTGFSWLRKAKNKEVTPLICTHSIAECYAVLTRLPLAPRIFPETAQYLLQCALENFTKISLSGVDYNWAIAYLVQLGLSGGILYDALILKAAYKAKAEKLLTLNRRDFVRLCPEKESFVLSPL